MDIVSDIGSAAKSAIGLAKHTKAKLIIKDKDNEPEDKAPIECMFNPTQYTLVQTATVNHAEIPSKAGADPQFQSTGPITLSMQLFFDDFASIRGDVTERITRLLSWQRPTKKNPTKPSPPYVGFEWGNTAQLANFRGILTSVTVTYKVFRKDGTPLQATVDVTIVGDVTLPPGTNPTSHALDTHRIRTTVEGESLQTIAYHELGRPTYWRAIAELNGIDDPLRVRPGAALLMPTVTDAARRG
jgi:hypothetical protein